MLAWRKGRVIASRDRIETRLVGQPDAMSIQAASLGLMTNTFSPGSVGVHSPGATRAGFTGLRGAGVNRFAGALDYRAGAVQPIGDPVAPLRNPLSARLGAGAMPSGQPGLPSAGQDDGGLGPLAWLGYGQLNNRTGLGG